MGRARPDVVALGLPSRTRALGASDARPHARRPFSGEPDALPLAAVRKSAGATHLGWRGDLPCSLSGVAPPHAKPRGRVPSIQRACPVALDWPPPLASRSVAYSRPTHVRAMLPNRGLWLAPLNGGCRPHPVSLNHLAGWDVDYPAPSMPHAHPRPGGRLSAIHRLRGRSLGVGIQAHDALPTPRHGSRGLPATRDHCDRRRRNLLRTKIGRRIDRERSRVRQFHRNSATSHGEQSPQLTRGLTRRARLLPRPPGARWLKAFSLAEPEATRKSNPPSLRFSTDAQFFAV